MTATFTKIKPTGAWGLRCPAGTVTGETVNVAARDGRVERKLVGRIVEVDAYGVVALIGTGVLGTPVERAPLAHVVTPPAFAGPTLPEGITLYAHQRDGISFLQGRRGALLADDMGLGKTCQTLLAVSLDAPVLVVCPAVAKGVWVREVAKFTPSRKAVALEGKKSFRWPAAGEVLCVNFDILPGATEENAAGFPCLPASLTSTMPQGLVVVIDEAHKVKNPKAKRTQSLRAICHEARERGGRAIGLTGTPLTNKPQETYAILVALGLQFEAFGGDRSMKPFERAMRLAGGSQGEYGWEFNLDRVKPEFAARLARVMLRRVKSEALNLPPKRFETLTVDVKPGDVKDADAVVAFLAAKGVDVNTADVAALSGSLVFEKMSKARAALAKAKINAALAIAEDCEEQGEPALFFSAYLGPVEALGAREGWGTITGQNPATRQQVMDDFQAGKLKGVACTIAAAGTALTLTRATRVVFVDQAWTPADNNQAMDRAHRIGTTESILVTTLVANHDLDARLADILAFKQEMTNATIEAARHLTVVPTAPVAKVAVVVRPAPVVVPVVAVDDFGDLPF